MPSHQDGSEFAQSGCPDGVPGPVAAALAIEDAGIGEHSEMVADGGLAQADSLGEVAHAGRALRLRAQEGEELESGWISDGLEELGQLLGSIA